MVTMQQKIFETIFETGGIIKWRESSPADMKNIII